MLTGAVVIMLTVALGPATTSATQTEAISANRDAAQIEEAGASATGASEVGWEQTTRVDDPSTDGLVRGALIGAAAGLALIATAYANCGDGCEAPSVAPTYALSAGFGAGVGAVIGWLIDKAHKGHAPSARHVTLAPTISKDRKGIAAAVSF